MIIFTAMYTCPVCKHMFADAPATHACRHPGLANFLADKPAYAVMLFDHLVNQYGEMGDVSVHAAKTMVGFAARKKFAYVIQFGKAFIDVVFPFKQPYPDNLCFNKIKPVPGSNDYNHHLRICFIEDINDEVRIYMQMAYELGC